MPATRKRSFNSFTNGSEIMKPPGQYDFAPDTSIVLIGIRGTGKSSLAFLAASTYGKTVIEFDREFHKRTGIALGEHCQDDKTSNGRKERKDILQAVLNDFSKEAVIVCDFSDLAYGSSVLSSYGKHHPVIHITRDIAGLQESSSTWSQETITHLSHSSASLLRRCCTHEFYNLTEDMDETSVDVRVSSYINASIGSSEFGQTPHFLRLKRIERDFLKFLRSIVGDHARSPYHQSAYPLSDLSLEERSRTYAVVTSAELILSEEIDLKTFQLGVDALILRTASPSKDRRDETFTSIGKAFASLRRSTILPIMLQPVPDGAEASDLLATIDHCRRLAPEFIMVPLYLEDRALSIPEQYRMIIRTTRTKLIGYCSSIPISSVESVIGNHDDPVFSGLIISVNGSDRQNLNQIQAMHQAWSQKLTRASMLSLFNSGMLGRHSQVMTAGILPVAGDDLSVRSSHSEDSRSDLTARGATKALFASYYFNALKYYIVGGKVDFSLSPAMHNAAYDALGMPHVFTTLSASSLDVLTELANDDSFGGIAVTQPYKVTVKDRLASLSEHARIIGAVNTVIPIRRASQMTHGISNLNIVTTRNECGKVLALYGDNTDWIGMRACLRRGLSPINAVRKSSTGLIIGAGGMARAGVYAMIHMGVKNIFVCNRTISTAEELANHFNDWLQSRADEINGVSIRQIKPVVHVIPSFTSSWPQGYRYPTMIISSVPAEMVTGRPQGTFKIPSEWLNSPSGGVVVDLTYNPLVTALVRQIKAIANKGWTIMTGLDMLPEQAFAQFELFTGRRAPRHIMQIEVLKVFKEMDRVSMATDG